MSLSRWSSPLSKLLGSTLSTTLSFTPLWMRTLKRASWPFSSAIFRTLSQLINRRARSQRGTVCNRHMVPAGKKTEACRATWVQTTWNWDSEQVASTKLESVHSSAIVTYLMGSTNEIMLPSGQSAWLPWQHEPKYNGLHFERLTSILIRTNSTHCFTILSVLLLLCFPDIILIPLCLTLHQRVE